MKSRLKVTLGAITITALLTVYWVCHAPPRPAARATKPAANSHVTTVAKRTFVRRSNVSSPILMPVSAPIPDNELMWTNEKVRRLIPDIELAINAVDDPQREELLQELISTLVRDDSTTAGFLAENWEPGSVQQELLRRVARTWATADSGGAIGWVVGLKDESDRKSAAMYVCEQIAESDPEAAVRASEMLELDGCRGMMEDLAQRWASEDFPAALAWARSRPDNDQRAKSLTRLALVQAQSDPVNAAALVASEMAPGANQDDAILIVLHTWAGKDLTAATAWVNQFPEGPLRERSAYELAAFAWSIASENAMD